MTRQLGMHLLELLTQDYGPDAVERVVFIRDAQAAGFTLQQIGQILAHDCPSEKTPAQPA